MSATAVARELIAQLVAAGVRHVVLSPGSRSAPLAYALAAAERAGWLTVHVRVDERSAGFVALGLARAAAMAGNPEAVAVVTTSGTAVANLHPAVLEASHGAVPLIVVSADRPHELRGTGANQTTEQVGIFGGAVRAMLDLPAGVAAGVLRGQVARIVAAALGTLGRDPGPVHVNVGLREPLVPQDRWEPGTPPTPVRVAPAAPGDPIAVPAGRRTLVVAGDGAGPAAAEVAEAAGWPLLAEPTSGARTGAAIVHYRQLLASGLADGVERVIAFGHPTLSRQVSALLARPGAVVVGGPRWTDVGGAAAAVVPGVVPPEPSAEDHAWLARWRAADAAAEDSWRPRPIERAARALWERDEVLVIGSSTAIRAFDRAARPRRTRAVANRGLAGIDGTISTAAGLAAGLGEPVRVALGDLAFLHDSGGLARGDLEPEVDLQVVVLDDHGGGIFATLEYGGEPDAGLLARYFTTPQRLEPDGIARAFGARYGRVAVEDLPAVLAEPVSGRSIVHVPLSQ